MNNYTLGPPTGGEQSRQVVTDLDSVRHFLEAPYELTPKDWEEAYDGLAQVVMAAERLTATLAERCPSADRSAGSERAADVGAAHDLLQEAVRRLTTKT